MDKNFPLVFAQNSTHTQGIVVIDSKSRAHLHVTLMRLMGHKSVMCRNVDKSERAHTW